MIIVSIILNINFTDTIDVGRVSKKEIQYKVDGDSIKPIFKYYVYYGGLSTKTYIVNETLYNNIEIDQKLELITYSSLETRRILLVSSLLFFIVSLIFVVVLNKK